VTPRAAGAAGPPARLLAQFIPLRLGAPTSVRFALEIDPPTLSAPPPLTGVDVQFPDDLGLATSGLGVAECQPGALEALGVAACPADSKVGSGSASVDVSFGIAVVQEHVTLTLFAGPSPDGYLHLLIAAEGSEPVQARIVIDGVLLPGELQLSVPVVPGLPGAPDVSIKQISATLGGALTYYEPTHGRLIAYRPRGIGLPASCPPQGWRMSATLAFQGGSQSRASDVVRCPRRRAKTTPRGR
jgi:hypothetical protein